MRRAVRWQRPRGASLLRAPVRPDQMLLGRSGGARRIGVACLACGGPTIRGHRIVRTRNGQVVGAFCSLGCYRGG